MSYPWDPPPGSAGDLQAAAKALGLIANDLSQQVTRAKAAAALAKSEWHAPRADDFAHAGQALVDELAMNMTAIGNTANLIGLWASAVQAATTNLATYKQNYDALTVHPPKVDPDPLTTAREQSNWIQQAMNVHTDLKTYAGKIAAAIDGETALAVPKSAGLSPDEIARRVDTACGMDNFTRGEFYGGKISDDAIWAMLHTADGPVYDTGVPAPGDSGFQAWYAGLTPAQQLLETQKLNASFDPGEGFDPYTHIQGGPMPQWAQTFNDMHQNSCDVNGMMGDGYGYFGGGTILGPGGTQWPIVMPYYNDGKNTYMDDDDGPAPDGGIEQLDGKDPGWHTVSTWTGAGQYGSVSTATKVATAFLIGTGQDLETTETDANAVTVGPDGRPYAGNDTKSMPSAPPDKEWWDVKSPTAFPENIESSDPRVTAMQPDLEWQEPALGASALLVQAGQAWTAVHNEDSHATRQYYVDYQVNDDGRARAVVHTYSATPTEDGKTYVGSFANTFPTGQSGYSTEIPYKTRHNPYPPGVTVATAAPDPNVEYSNDGDDEINHDQPIPEKLNK